MKKTKLIAVLMAVMCVFACAACGATYDPVTHVQGELDAYYHGLYNEDYIAMLGDGTTEQILRDQNEALTNSGVDSLIMSYDIYNPSAELEALVTDMINTWYDAMKYEVGEATEGEDCYVVEVTAYPLLTYDEVLDDADGTLEDTIMSLTNDSMSDEEWNTIALTEVCNALISALANPTYGDPVTVEITLNLGSDGLYVLSESDFIELENSLLNY